MQFRTELSISPSPSPISLDHGIVTLGSCFADVIGQKLLQHKANVLVNPFGTVFNPMSTHALLRRVILQDTEDLHEGLVERHGQWYHYDFHSSFTSPDPEALIQRLKVSIQQAHSFLQQTKAILITWGTAFVYERLDTGVSVSNCHKVPQKQFTKRMLSVQEIETDLQNTLTLLQNHFTDILVILTVSPVRHIKDTLVLNSVSKSILRVAAHQVQEQNAKVSYFPAYELLLDDLRDYRFYGSDLLHPSEMAENYIWEKFVPAYLDQDFANFIKMWHQIQQDLSHRAFAPDSPGHQKFLSQLLSKLQNLSPSLDLQLEIDLIKSQLLP